ncbi:nitric oxide-sensing transcriptional repressor NsrR [Streptomyces thermolineatus]|uniref:Nitric oxide-sensing transcriptional repressor NsrR n=1 Tax=Streptomyces thermolineatus TaxID=44033 RepID=A0ABN3MKK3_9ACTN|nr:MULTISPECIES: Rrf2 family transcriptional regulator [unclassified Streptomyces]MCZ2524790.1 Rrf2 family transcriptional regulator [Streptomyces sp. HB2AG]PLW69065.1 transcriptional regulator [Streptomyces sp. DJ]QMV21142.1 Rrf2 family transcriptional regulator [Streptomyces sp. SCUT-3]
MRLTKFTDLALRVAMLLAARTEEAELLRTRDVAEALAVPYSHAAKVVSRLQHLGVVEARRGRGGGLALAGSGADVSVGRLVRELEGEGDVVGCDDEPPCPLRRACRLRSALRTAQEAFFASLDPLTVADLTAAPTGPVLLGLGPTVTSPPPVSP